MLRNAAFAAPRTDSRDLRIISLLLRSIGAGGELDKSVKGDGHPGRFLLGFLHKVRVDATKDCLMRDDEDIFAALKFHNDGLQADDDVTITMK